MSAEKHQEIRAEATEESGGIERKQGTLLEDMSWIGRYMRPLWKWLLTLLGLLVVWSGAKQGRGALIAPFFDGAIADRSLDKLNMIVLILLVLSVVGGVIAYFQRYVSRLIREKVMVNIRMDIFERLLKLPLQFFSRRKQGDIISRVTNDIEETNQAVHVLMTRIIKEPFMALGALGVALLASWKLTLIGLLAVPLVVIPVKKLGERIKRSKDESLLELSDVVEALNQILSGIRVVKIFQGEEQETRNFRETNRRLLNRNMKVVKNKGMSNAMLFALTGVLLAAFFWGGSWLVISNYSPISLSMGELIQFLGGVLLLYQPLKKLTKGYNEIQESRAAVQRLRELLDERHLVADEHSGTRKLKGIEEGIEIDDVSFSYDEKTVLKDVNLKIPARDVVALVGPSGAGKSTLMDLISRFYVPDEGSIRVDSIPLDELNRTSYLNNISIVSQNSFLFNTSIEENIRYGKPDADQDEIREVAKAAYIHEFIESLPEGYQTEVGEQGVRVSGGEKQRITIARAMIKDADLLLLDEATSELDSRSEEMVQKALNRLISDRTCIIIAHRLSTVKNADRIVVMEEGRIVQEGPHRELVEREGLYQQLHELQFNMADSA